MPDLSPDPVARELLALIVASPEPLTLDDLVELSANVNAIVIDGHLSTLSFLIVDDGLESGWFTKNSLRSSGALLPAARH